MEHRLPALRLAFVQVILFATVDIIWNLKPWEMIVFGAFGLFLVSPLADYIERKER